MCNKTNVRSFFQYVNKSTRQHNINLSLLHSCPKFKHFHSDFSLTVKTFGFEYPLYVSLTLTLREMDWLVIRRQIWSTPVHLVQVTIILLSFNMPNLGSDYSSYHKCKIIKYAAENQFNLNIEFIEGVYKNFMKETHNQISNTQKHAVYPNGSVTYYHSFLTVTTNLNPVEYHPHSDILKHVDRGLLHAWQALESVQ